MRKAMSVRHQAMRVRQASALLLVPMLAVLVMLLINLSLLQRPSLRYSSVCVRVCVCELICEHKKLMCEHFF